MPRVDRLQVRLAREHPHDGQVQERVRQLVVESGARRRLGVVLGEHHLAGRLDDEHVRPRVGARFPEAGIRLEHLLFPVGQPELGAHGGVGECRVVRRGERPHQHVHAPADRAGPWPGQEAGPENGAQRAIAEHQVAAAQLRIQHGVGRFGDPVGQQRVIGVDVRAHAPPAPGVWSAVNSASHRSAAACRDGCFASRMAMSAMCVTTQSKLGCFSELMSMSGAGFMKSIA